MKNLLLTGGFGYIGSKFIEKFSNKYNIFCLDTAYYGIDLKLKKLIYDFYQIDIRNISSKHLKNIDYVVHMGELCNDPLSEFNPLITKKINIEGTKNLIELCNDANIKKFIYMSSCSVYGFSNLENVNEESEVFGLTEYANAKIENEKFIKDNKLNFETIILRNATAYGVSSNMRLDIVLNDLVFEAITNNSLTLHSDGSPIRPLVHISDICNFIDMFINTEENYDKMIFNIGENKSNITIKELAELVSKVLKINELKFGSSTPDNRSYKVIFDKLENEFPNYIFEFDLVTGIKELGDLFYENSNYPNGKRINSIKNNLKNNSLDLDLYWKI